MDLKIKRIAKASVKDIELCNGARRLAGLPLIKIKVRRCISCFGMFESDGNRTCGCLSNEEDIND